MSEKTKYKTLKVVGIVSLVLTVLLAVAWKAGLFFKKYSFAWTGGQKANVLADGKYYAGLMLTEPNGKPGAPDIKVGDYVNITSTDAPGLVGKHKVLQLGDDMGAYVDMMIVVDVLMGAVEATGSLDTRGAGTIKKVA